MFKGIENIPFFLYHMFSTKHQPQSSYLILAIKTDKGFFDSKSLSNREYELLIGSAEHYAKLQTTGDPTSKLIDSRFGKMGSELTNYANKHLVNDSISIEQYPRWWARYFTKITGGKFNTAGIVYMHISYVDSQVIATPGDILFTEKLRE
ncbi:MAG: hypothetical protein ABIQ56_01435 [Chitinophagaceae bacterium]